MKKLVLTASIGQRDFNKLTIDSIEKYAKKIGADYRYIKEYEVDDKYQNIPIGRKGNKGYLIKLLVIGDALKEYDRVIWFDDSCVVASDCPDLFNVVPTETLGAHNEGIVEWVSADKVTKKFYEHHGMKNYINYKNYFNSGVMVLSKSHIDLFSEENIINFGEKGHMSNGFVDQTYLNFLVGVFRTPFFALPSIFNRMSVCIPEYKGKFMHYEEWNATEFTLAANLSNFGWLSKESVSAGMHNWAYVYHITSMYPSTPRMNLIEKLHELKVDK